MQETNNIKDRCTEICILEKGLETRLNGFHSERQVLALDSSVSFQIPDYEGLTLSVWVVTHAFLMEKKETVWEWIMNHPQYDLKLIVLSGTKSAREEYRPISPEMIHLILPGNVEPDLLNDVIEGAFYSLALRYEKLRLQSRLALSYQDIRRLTRVGQSMATERDFGTLIGLILNEARELTNADGGSIYVVERSSTGEKPTHLRFKKSALNLNADEFLLTIDNNSIAGYVALNGQPLLIDDVYALNGQEEYRFNYEFDKAHNYHSRSMMVIPMKNHREDVIGVIQLINRKKNVKKKLTLAEMKGPEVLPFDQKSLELGMALAGQAAVAIQNSLLLQDINNLFEGFVKASVTAIEQRDPTTSGHSFRVADFTVGLAMAVDRLSDGPFQNVKFNMEQIREIRYASLLHDFGKVGVREKVLVKAKKLYEHELELIDWRFKYIRKAVEKEYLERKFRHLKEGRAEYEAYEKLLDQEMNEKLEQISRMFATIVESNEPAVVEEGNFSFLEQIAMHKIRMDDGAKIPFLKQNELVSLSIRRGNLDQAERLEIESHVTHTYRFLIQIPWTTDLRRIPDIARGHHEKLDGTGYPLGLRESEIAVQTRMMTISDIYDALTAPDRPYKKSLTPEKAIDILKIEAKEKHVDDELLNIFIQAEVFRRTDDF